MLRYILQKATGYHTYPISGKTASLGPKFAEDLPSAELQLGSCACSEGPAHGQNILIYVLSRVYENLLSETTMFSEYKTT